MQVRRCRARVGRALPGGQRSKRALQALLAGQERIIRVILPYRETQRFPAGTPLLESLCQPNRPAGGATAEHAVAGPHVLQTLPLAVTRTAPRRSIASTRHSLRFR